MLKNMGLSYLFIELKNKDTKTYRFQLLQNIHSLVWKQI